jgi:hypothetical protein
MLGGAGWAVNSDDKEGDVGWVAMRAVHGGDNEDDAGDKLGSSRLWRSEQWAMRVVHGGWTRQRCKGGADCWVDGVRVLRWARVACGEACFRFGYGLFLFWDGFGYGGSKGLGQRVCEFVVLISGWVLEGWWVVWLCDLVMCNCR